MIKPIRRNLAARILLTAVLLSIGTVFAENPKAADTDAMTADALVPDADALIAHVLERVAYLESLYDKGIEVEYEKEKVMEGDEYPAARIAHRVVYHDLFELDQWKYLSESRDSPLKDGVEETLEVKNPKYSFILNKEKANTLYAMEDLYNDRNGIMMEQNTNGLFEETAQSLVGLYIVELSLRELLCSDTFKVESVEKQQNEYRLVFHCDVPIDLCNRLVRGELYFSAEDYSVVGWDVVGKFSFLHVDKPSKQWTDRTRYTYGQWQGIRYPKSIECHIEHSSGEVIDYQVTFQSVQMVSPNKKEFYLKYYGIAEPDSPKNAPSPAIFIAVGLILIGMGIYLKRRAAAGSAESK